MTTVTTEKTTVLALTEHEVMLLQMAMEGLVHEMKQEEFLVNATAKAVNLLESLYNVK